jgi:hypothetical protein
MSTIQVKTELSFEELLKAVAQLNAEDLEQLLTQVVALRAKQQSLNLSEMETELLLKINQGLPATLQQQFDELVGKRRAETLTAAEHQELLQLTDRIEQADVERMTHLAALARLRGTSLPTLMKELGIQQPAYA